MPELPEVETVRLDLETHLVGRSVRAVRVTGRRTIRRQEIAAFEDELSGRTVTAARRRGKYLLCDLDDGAVLVIHLRMSGQLRLVAYDTAVESHSHVRISLDSGDELRFVDPRTFGELFVTDELDARRVPLALARLGRDPIVDGVAVEDLAPLVARRRTALKAFLLDQSAICGIGNIYADEICFAARLSPLKRTETISRAQLTRLVAAIDSVLLAAVNARGSSLRDLRYRDLTGGLGTFQRQHATYDRAGLPCPRCGRPIKRSSVVGRSTYFCSWCQR